MEREGGLRWYALYYIEKEHEIRNLMFLLHFFTFFYFLLTFFLQFVTFTLLRYFL